MDTLHVTYEKVNSLNVWTGPYHLIRQHGMECESVHIWSADKLIFFIVQQLQTGQFTVLIMCNYCVTTCVILGNKTFCNAMNDNGKNVEKNVSTCTACISSAWDHHHTMSEILSSASETKKQIAQLKGACTMSEILSSVSDTKNKLLNLKGHAHTCSFLWRRFPLCTHTLLQQ